MKEMIGPFGTIASIIDYDLHYTIEMLAVGTGNDDKNIGG